MKKYEIIYKHKVEITYKAIVEAENELAAEENLYNGSILIEYEEDYQGLEMDIIEISEV